MRKNIFILVLLLLNTICCFSQQIVKNGIVVVRPQYDNQRERFLTNFATSLRIDGYAQSAEILDAYTKGIANGIPFTDKTNERTYILTVQDAVVQANSVTIEFPEGEKSVASFQNCKVVAIDETSGLAIVELPETTKLNTELFIPFSIQTMEDGIDVFSVGYSLLAKSPSWQLSKGIVSNAFFYPSNEKIVPLIQHTAQTTASSAGGALLIRNPEYEIVGINVWKITERENVNFAIPASAAKAFIERFLETQSRKQTVPDLKSTVQTLFLSDINKDGYADVLPFISRNYIYSLSAYTFYNLNKAATTEAQNNVKELLTQGKPIKGFHTLLADRITQQLAQKSFTISYVSDIQGKNGEALVELTENGNTVSTTWVQEDGQWKMSNFPALEIKKLAELQSKEISETFQLQWYVTVGGRMPFRENEKPKYGLQIGTLFWKHIPIEAAYYRGNMDILKPAGYDTKLDKEILEQNRINYGSFELRSGVMYPLKVNRKFYVIPALKGAFRTEMADDLNRTGIGAIVQINGVYRLNNTIGLLMSCSYNQYFFLKDGYEDPEYLKPIGGVEMNIGIAF
ncbi:trypsin-like peptidase domain-containing protein [Petrimonas sp.]|uniref:trypsin-like peptidase domain-containing protein n=1 Tax=Petrimonas sp. TaxID=2023866 RepID=UPI003F515FBA